MNGMVKKCLQWTYLSVICLIVFGAFIMLAGEENPYEPIPLGEWLLIKTTAMAVFVMVALIGRWLYRLGLLPEFLHKMLEGEV